MDGFPDPGLDLGADLGWESYLALDVILGFLCRTPGARARTLQILEVSTGVQCGDGGNGDLHSDR